MAHVGLLALMEVDEAEGEHFDRVMAVEGGTCSSGKGGPGRMPPASLRPERRAEATAYRGAGQDVGHG
ncbi:hypothetical protein GCM10009665_75360 [Kitasatospora nipponensis]|uniref:Uncharacterized protein n=1 Tax=Kitasatospora nipponensis TaxID=258049 RepID=A0ABP4DU67_9ACTN